MALDMERPSNAHSPEQHSLSGGSSLGGLPVNHLQNRRNGRSSVERECPDDDSRNNQLRPSVQHMGVEPPALSLKFSIEKILSPDFGRKGDAHPAHREKRSSTSKATTEHPKEKSSNEKQLSAQNENTLPTNNTAHLYPWIYCTRYSDRPSSGPRSRRMKKKDRSAADAKRPRTAFTGDQLARLKQEFLENRYLTEKRRQDLSRELKLNESQIKIWFQNKRAKQKKQSGRLNPLAISLLAQGLYNHSTVPIRDDEDEERPMSSSSS